MSGGGAGSTVSAIAGSLANHDHIVRTVWDSFVSGSCQTGDFKYLLRRWVQEQVKMSPNMGISKHHLIPQKGKPLYGNPCMIPPENVWDTISPC